MQGGQPHPTLEIFLLGGFGVRVNGASISEQAWTRRSAKLLVKLLALSPQHQLHREQIIDLLWAEQDPETALNSLNKAIYMARRALEPTLTKGSASRFIATRKQLVALDSEAEYFVDVEEFERHAQACLRKNDIDAGKRALDIYRGDLLSEDLYEDWLSGRRESLRLLYRKVATKTSELFCAEGEFRPAIDALKKLAAEDGTDEHVHRQLMQLYAKTGSKYQAQKQ